MKNKLALFGFFILSYMLYRRFFRIRLPKDILPTDDIYIIAVNIALCLSTVVITCIYVFVYIKFLLKKETNYSNTSLIIIKFKTLYENKWNPILICQNSLLALDILLKNKIPMYDENRDYLDIIIMNIGTFFIKYTFMFKFVFIFSPIIFQSIVLISFIEDVFINNKFYYFYNNVWLLIFPLITTYIIYSIKIYLDTNLASLENVIILKVIKTSDYILYKDKAPTYQVSIQDWRDISTNTPKGFYLCQHTLSSSFTKNKEQLDHAETLSYCVNSLEEFIFVYALLDRYILLKKTILIPFNILKYTSYSLCWGFIVILLLS